MEKVWTNGAEGHNSKYKRETLLNYGMNRWGLNKASSVGATSELIRECAPSSYEDWVEFYFNEAVQKKKRGIKITQEYLRTLGEELYNFLKMYKVNWPALQKKNALTMFTIWSSIVLTRATLQKSKPYTDN